jgi:hypothetical protein
MDLKTFSQTTSEGTVKPRRCLLHVGLTSYGRVKIEVGNIPPLSKKHSKSLKLKKTSIPKDLRLKTHTHTHFQNFKNFTKTQNFQKLKIFH